MITLGGDVITWVALLLALMLGLIAAQLWLYVRTQRDKELWLVQMALFSGFAACLGYFMDAVILGLPAEEFFRHGGRIALLVCLALTGLFVLLRWRSGGSPLSKMSPDLKMVIEAVNDLIIILDYQGNIVEVNRPHVFAELFGESRCWQDIVANLATKAALLLPEDKETLQAQRRYDISLEEEDSHYIVNVNPIVAGGSYIGSAMVLHDVSATHQAGRQIILQNEYLNRANLKLEQYVRVAHDLEAERERLALLEKIQRDLMVKIEQSIAELRSIRATIYADDKTFKQDTWKFAERLRRVYRDVRQAVRQVAGGAGG